MQNHIEEIVGLLKEYNLDVISIQADGMGQFQGPNAHTVFYSAEMGERSKMQNHIEEIARLLKDSNLTYILIRRNGDGIFKTSQGKDIPFYSPQQGVVFFRENQIQMIENRISEKKEELEELEKLLGQVNEGKNVFDNEK